MVVKSGINGTQDFGVESLLNNSTLRTIYLDLHEIAGEEYNEAEIGPDEDTRDGLIQLAEFEDQIAADLALLEPTSSRLIQVPIRFTFRRTDYRL